MSAPHEPARYPWPDGFREHLVEQCDGFSSLMSRAISDNGASLFGDGPYAKTGPQGASMDATGVMFRKIREFAREYLWPR
ncbi:hypothetical protein [Rhodococcus sp. MEB064]|jgi:hypothetical protein|uniref:hypothetical protein n=1 Tax=Rhodococcus sp. MEB064 TaxID=1587522 RepID=UPI0005AC1F9A|nr:hypothetical protein [Rhodococcus sp. MEB064]KIQ18378.1 inositol 2-dehydrogenase [Rhodococcus sp. MEB064]